MTLVGARAKHSRHGRGCAPGGNNYRGVWRPGFRGRRKAAYWADLLDAGHIGEERGIPSCTNFHATHRVQDSRIVTAGEEWSDARKWPFCDFTDSLAMLRRSEAVLTWYRFEV